MQLLTWIAQAEYGSWFRPYAFLLVAGFLITIIACWIRLYARKIPTKSFEIGIFIIIPFAVIGASIIGKWDPNHPIWFWELFAFWDPGLSIHGGLIFGIIAGLIWFRFCSNRENISLLLYSDLILPNILLGQAIGRWGNFFNHELFGKQVSYQSLSWLPSFIRNSCFKWYPDPNGNLPTLAWDVTHTHGVDPTQISQVAWFAPIYLYESFFNFMLWILIIFVIPWFLKFVIWLTHRRDLPSDGIVAWWSKYYYNLTPDPLLVKQSSEVMNHYRGYQKLRKKTTSYWIRLKLWFHWKWLRISQLWTQNRSQLELLENPHRLVVLRCGVQGGLYWFGYNFIRFLLELQREPADLFLINMLVVDYIVLWIFIIAGLLAIIIAQFIAPLKWRQGGWLYEKQY